MPSIPHSWTSLRSLSLSALLLSAAAAQPAGYKGAPYQGRPQPIPGRIQLELYDTGGEGVAYHDTDAVNNGSGQLNKGDAFVDRFRQDEGVDLSYTKKDIDKTVDGAQEQVGELYLGWTAPGEWVNYTVEVRESGTYAILGHMTSRSYLAQISLAFDGLDQTGPIRLPGTTHWHTWRMAPELARVRLDKGTHVMKLSVLKEGNFNLDYIEFVPVTGGPAAQTVNWPDPFEQVRRMTRGVNIIGYDPLWKDFSKARFQDRHFRRIRDAGFQHVRINLHAFAYMDAQNRLSQEWFKTLQWAVDGALANGLMVILDEHNFTACGQDAETCKPKLMAFWEQVAPRFADAPPEVLFEILNEPNGKVTAEMWNAWLAEALSIIRKTNPVRHIVIGPANWNNIRALDTMKLPEGDRHIIATVHYYLPMSFTHQGARWAGENAKLSGIPWGTDEEKGKMEADFDGVQQWSKANSRPILLGEFGAYDKAEMDSRVRYTAHVARTAERLGWAWSYWQFDSDFIVYDIVKDDWVAPIKGALVP